MKLNIGIGTILHNDKEDGVPLNFPQYPDLEVVGLCPPKLIAVRLATPREYREPVVWYVLKDLLEYYSPTE